MISWSTNGECRGLVKESDKHMVRRQCVVFWLFGERHTNAKTMFTKDTKEQRDGDGVQGGTRKTE